MELERLSALQLGKLVKRRSVKPTEVIDYFFDRINKRNPSINAFVYVKYQDAMKEAHNLEEKLQKGERVGSFAGVPIGLKDFLPSKKGWPATHGGVKSLQTIDHVNGVFYRAARDLGCIAIGKTNAPSFGFRGTTDNKMYGPTSTPFHVGYNSGGSSGGSGAAVGDGLVPIAEGGDAGGSVRIPAAWCGCFGFKPSAGVVPSVIRPDAWTATHPYCCPGPITRTVEDAAVIVNSMCKFNPRDPLSVPLPPSDLVKAARQGATKGIKDLKIAVTLDFNLFPSPDKEIVSEIEDTVNQLQREGIRVDWVTFNFCEPERHRIERAWLQGISMDSAIDFMLWKQSGQYDLNEHLEDYPEEFLYWNDVATNATALDYREFHDVRTKILDAHQDIFDRYDLILAPVSGCLPVLNAKDNNTKGPDSINGEEVDPLIGFGYTYLENMIGAPAASVPIGVSRHNLPIGLQVIGRRYQDNNVFRFCGFLENIRPWNYDIPYHRNV